MVITKTADSKPSESKPSQTQTTTESAVVSEAGETMSGEQATPKPPPSKEASPSPQRPVASNDPTAVINRNISFRISKIKKETLSGKAGAEAGVAEVVETVGDGVSRGASPTRTYQPRKKLEKLNYKVGAGILEVYKERNRAKLQEAAINTQEVAVSASKWP